MSGNPDRRRGWKIATFTLDKGLCSRHCSKTSKVVLKRILPTLLGAALLTISSGSMADEYRPAEFLNLDLSKALLSPTPLGPRAEFAPGPVRASSERAGNAAQAQARPAAEIAKAAAQSMPGVQTVKTAEAGEPDVMPHGEVGVTHARVAKPRRAARAGLAQRHGNPLNAQARDTRIQKWPCNPDSGGICSWQR